MSLELAVDHAIKKQLDYKLKNLESHLHGDLVFFYGPIHDGFSAHIDKIIREIPKRKERLFFMLTTPGGSATEVERTVNVIRNFYNEVNFIIPDYAYSAGTIFCMSGDNIYMDYFGVLGPIDPQVPNKDNKYIPAQGYLEKVAELIKKSQQEHLSEAEMLLLGKMDLADLRLYEQARELTVDLLKEWLVKYKFKNWTEHCTSPEKIGTAVTDDEKLQAATHIAKLLSDNNRWRQHGRGINIYTLVNELRLQIIDYGKIPDLSKKIRDYYDIVIDYALKNSAFYYTHARGVFF